MVRVDDLTGANATANTMMAQGSRLRNEMSPPTSRGVLPPYVLPWIILGLLAVLDAVLNLIEPFHRFVGAEMMAPLMYPMKANTVPFWAVQLFCIIGPIIIITTVTYFKRHPLYDFHHAILALLFSVLITGVITDAIKDAVGRPRPDFFWRCFPDGVAAYKNFTKGVLCHGKASVIKEGHKSFPSAHASWAFAGLGFLSWYLAGEVNFDRRSHLAELCIILLPLLPAVIVSVSQINDYWHHWGDVFAGGILGLAVAKFCYLCSIPLSSHENAEATPAVGTAGLESDKSGSMRPNVAYGQSSINSEVTTNSTSHAANTSEDESSSEKNEKMQKGALSFLHTIADKMPTLFTFLISVWAMLLVYSNQRGERLNVPNVLIQAFFTIFGILIISSNLLNAFASYFKEIEPTNEDLGFQLFSAAMLVVLFDARDR